MKKKNIFQPTFQRTFFDQTFDKNRIKKMISQFYSDSLISRDLTLLELLEKLKTFGFQEATKAGISIGIDDLTPPITKKILFEKTTDDVEKANAQFLRNELSPLERFQKFLDSWQRTTELLKLDVVKHFERTDILNPVYMMAFSGARGNITQVSQLVAMRGFMADPEGRVIDYPIRSNFREGLTLTEYVISCYGARKGVIDTALRTADAGYLTRRLVDVAHHAVISQKDCGTTKGFWVSAIKKNATILYPLEKRLVGRVLFGRLFFYLREKDDPYLERRVFSERKFGMNQQLDPIKAQLLAFYFKKVRIRSAFSCRFKKRLCQFCYGWTIPHCHLAPLGEAVGILAAQSIGEPGTQLTMRTFHTGGVFSGQLSDEIRAPYSGIVEYNQAFKGHLIRTNQGQIGFMTKEAGFLRILPPDQKPLQKIFQLDFPKLTILFFRNHYTIQMNDLILEFPKEADDEKEETLSQYVYCARRSGVIRTTRKFFNFDLKMDFNLMSKEKIMNQQYKRPDHYKWPNDMWEWIKYVSTPEASQEFFQEESFSSLKELRAVPSGWLQTVNREINIQWLMISASHLYSINAIKFPTFKKAEVMPKKMGCDNSRDLPLMNEFLPKKGDVVNQNVIYHLTDLVNFESNGKSNLAQRVFQKSILTFKFLKIYYRQIGYFVQQNDSDIIFLPGLKKFSKNLEIRFFEKKYETKRAGDLLFLDFLPYAFLWTSAPIFYELEKSTLKGKTKKIIGRVFSSKEMTGMNPSVNDWKQRDIAFLKQRNLQGKIRHFQSKKDGFLRIFQKKKLMLSPPLAWESCQNRLRQLFVFKTGWPYTGLLRNFQNLQTYFYGKESMKDLIFDRDVCSNEPLFRNQIPFRHRFSQKRHRFYKPFGDQIKNRAIIFLMKPMKEYSFKKENEQKLLKVITQTEQLKAFKKHQFIKSWDRNLFLLDLFASMNRQFKNSMIFNNLINYVNWMVFQPFKTKKFKVFKTQNWVRSSILIDQKSLFKKTTFELSKTCHLGFEVFLDKKLDATNAVDNFSNVLISKKEQEINSPFIKILSKSPYTGEVIGTETNKGTLILTSKDIIFISLPSPTLLNCGIGRYVKYGDEILKNRANPHSGQIVSVTKNMMQLRLCDFVFSSGNAEFFCKNDEFLKKNARIFAKSYPRLVIGDIIQGIPKITEFFEARDTRNGVLFSGSVNNKLRLRYDLYLEKYGYLKACRQSVFFIQHYILNSIYKLYLSQGIAISDKHLEIIVREMTSKVKVIRSPYPQALPNEIYSRRSLERFTKFVSFSKLIFRFKGREKEFYYKQNPPSVFPFKRENYPKRDYIRWATWYPRRRWIIYEPIVLGITKAALSTKSVISKASFQETTRMLSIGVLKQTKDFLRGLKENIILGHLVPVGTGLRRRFLRRRMSLYKMAGNLKFDLLSIFILNLKYKNPLKYKNSPFILNPIRRSLIKILFHQSKRGRRLFKVRKRDKSVRPYVAEMQEKL